MDYESLIYAAKKNEQKKKEPVKWLQTKFKPPSKQQKEKEKVLSEGVQKFLAKKEEEEKRKQIEAEKRKVELLALRAKDPKANKRIQTMLKRTKSANKSVMEDAIDNNNTADTLAGPIQPDDDDYGFVSDVASAAYQKLMQKLYNTPSDDQPNFAPKKKPTGGNLLNTKERVKLALIKEKEDELLPRKRKKKEKDKKDDDGDPELDFSAPDRDYKSDKGKEEKPKIRKPMPPPMDFQQLLKLAEQKQFEPVVGVTEMKAKKTEEPEMLMTKKQKLEYEKLQEYRRRRKERENGVVSTTTNDNSKPVESKEEKKVTKSGPDTFNKIPKISKINNEQKSVSKSAESGSERRIDDKQREILRQKTQEVHRKVEKRKETKSTSSVDDDEDDELEKLRRERDEAMRLLKEKEKLIKEKNEMAKRLKEKEKLIRERDEVMRKLKMFEEEETKKCADGKSSKQPGKVVKPPEQRKLPPSPYDKKKPNGLSEVSKDICARELPPKDLKLKTSVREFPPKDLQPKTSVREFPPKDLVSKTGVRELTPKDQQSRPGISQKSKQFPPSDVRRKPPPSNKRRIEDSDEYDSELEDFIDDDPGVDLKQEDVSRVISEIFKYDRNKYSRYDDVECEESNFARISKEEFHSAKVGLLEDLEDMQKERREKEMKKKRLLMLKKNKNR